LNQQNLLPTVKSRQRSGRIDLLLSLACGVVIFSVFEQLILFPALPIGKTPPAALGLVTAIVFAFRVLPSYQPTNSAERWAVGLALITCFSFLATAPPGGFSYAVASFLSWFQSIVLFLIISYVAGRDVQSIKLLILSFIACGLSMVALSGAHEMGFGFIQLDESVERTGYEGVNLNRQAFVFALAGLVVGWSILEQPGLTVRGNVIRLFGFMVLVGGLFLTGSRTGFGAFCISLFALLIISGTNKLSLRVIAAATLIMAIIAYLFIATSILGDRLTETIEDGDYGHRDELAIAAWELVTERPWFGYGPIASVLLGKATGRNKPIDAHNAHLQIMIKFGIPPYLVWLFMMLSLTRQALLLRNEKTGRLALVIILSMFAYSFTGSLGSSNYFWIALGILTGAFRLKSYSLVRGV